jgi:hypothetical protein
VDSKSIIWCWWLLFDKTGSISMFLTPILSGEYIYIYIYIYKKSMNCTITFLIWIFFIATWLNKKIWRTARVT